MAPRAEATVAVKRAVVGTAALAVLVAGPLWAQQRDSSLVLSHDSVTVHLVDVDLRAAVQALAPFIDRPVVYASSIPSARVTIETPHPTPRTDVLDLMRGMLASQNLELVQDSSFYRIAPKAPAAAPAVAPTPSATGGTVQLYVIHLHHARAADVAATVNALYGRSSALGEIGGSRPATLDQQLQTKQVPPVGAVAAPPGSIASVAGKSATLQGDVTIVPDSRSNSLLIRATASDFELIQAAVNELDTRPLEVLIEVIIAEVQRDRSLSFGLDATLPPNQIRGTKTTVSGTQQGAGLTDFVVQLMHVSGLDIDATLSAAASRGEVRILSRPVVIAANNEQATINVGSQRPFVQVSRTLATDNTARDEVVQYEDVGTKLTILPTISPDGYVGLEVTQEVNDATSEVAFNAPVISTRSVQTTLLIKDGHTVVLGGLSDRQRDVNQGGVPVLSSIPLIGGLFGHVSRETTETELYLFLTPHVIHTDDEADQLTNPLRAHIEKEKP